MSAISTAHLAILKTKLLAEYVPFLPPLIDKSRPAEQADKQLSRAYSAYVLQKTLDISIADACAAVADDFDDNGIDALIYIAPTLYCVQVKLKHTAQFDETDAVKFTNGARLLLHQDYATFNENIKRRIDEINSAFDDASCIQLIIGYVGTGVSQHARAVLQAFIDQERADEPRLQSNWIEFDAAMTCEKMLAEKSVGVVNTTLSLTKLHSIQEPRPTYYGIARIQDLVKLHEDHSKALYERNIRYFLGSKTSDVNRSIQRTLRENAQAFFYLNNGVTALATQIEVKGTKGAPKLKVRELSIINGAQTISSAAEFVQKNPEHDITKAKVLFTIIEASTESNFGMSVTRARNHQNPVSTGNFASLDPEQERLRRELDYLGYSYLYRPEVLPSDADRTEKIITIDLAMRALAIFEKDSRIPYWLKNDISRFHDTESSAYSIIFGSQPTGASLVNKVNCYRFIRNVLQANDAAGHGAERLFYRHGAFLIASVLAKRLTALVNSAVVIPSDQLRDKLSPLLDECRQTCWDNAIGTVGAGSGVLAFFRNQAQTVILLERCMIAFYNMSTHPNLAAIRAQSTVNEAYPRERVFRFLADHCSKI